MSSKNEMIFKIYTFDQKYYKHKYDAYYKNTLKNILCAIAIQAAPKMIRIKTK